jgi:hypothetical protein
LTEALCHYGVKTDRSNGFFVLLDPGEKRGPVLDAIGQLTAESVIRGLGSNDQAEKALKFSECLPPLMRTKEVVGRRCTVTDLESVLTEPRHVAAVTEVEVI